MQTAPAPDGPDDPGRQPPVAEPGADRHRACRLGAPGPAPGAPRDVVARVKDHGSPQRGRGGGIPGRGAAGNRVQPGPIRLPSPRQMLTIPALRAPYLAIA